MSRQNCAVRSGRKHRNKRTSAIDSAARCPEIPRDASIRELHTPAGTANHTKESHTT